ncbi:hypothetical protein [Nicoliella lavandulae]|uniref:Uncharacterized protein n=1 Tax=Nicoliella lavandulae TaxID=3082954 RepID=A0ABU8SMK5_9LACO
MVSIVVYLVKLLRSYYKSGKDTKNEAYRRNFKRFFTNIVLMFVFFLIGGLLLPNGDSSKPSKPRLTAKQKAASSSKASSESEDKKASSEMSSEKAKNEKNNKKDLDKKLQEYADKQSNGIQSVENDGTTITVTLDSSTTDSSTDDEMRQYCSSLYHSMESWVKYYNQDTPYFRILDSDDKTIAKTTFLGDYKYVGLDN